jgi:hypothetical protein
VPNPAVHMKSVFISHISDETELAQWLKSRLDRDFLGTLDIFVSSDRSTIGAGRKWLDEVDKALKKADLQIILCSRESVGRPWVNFEVASTLGLRAPSTDLAAVASEARDLEAKYAGQVSSTRVRSRSTCAICPRSTATRIRRRRCAHCSRPSGRLAHASTL